MKFLDDAPATPSAPKPKFPPQPVCRHQWFSRGPFTAGCSRCGAIIDRAVLERDGIVVRVPG
jgi:hypothetical protein